VKEILLHDPTRRPPDWISAMSPGQFAVLYSDVRAGVAVDANGDPLGKGVRQTCLIFDSFDEAQTYCQQRVLEAPNLQCRIYDHHGSAQAPVLDIVNPKFPGKLGSPQSARAKMIWGVAVTSLSVPLFLADYFWNLRYLPTLVGLNCFIVGLRLLHWGYCDLEMLRERQRRLNAVKAGSR
jgi:hypothetical protein